MTSPEEPVQPAYSDKRWIESIYTSHQVDGAVAEEWNPYDTLMGAIIEGRTLEEQQGSEHQADPGVKIKNRFLGLLAELSDDSRYHVSDLLALLDRQAETIPDANETRYRQFMGLWDLAVALSKDEDLTEKLRTQY